jgi:DDE superfamily endonuclease/Archaeal putative transposase ISC1217
MASISGRTRRRRRHEARRQRRQQQARRARHVRRQLRELLDTAPSPAADLLAALADAFTRPTFLRFALLLLAALLTLGGRTVSNLLRTLGGAAPGDPSAYHKVFSQRRWCVWRLSRALTGFVLQHFLPTGPIDLTGDDTVCEHPGAKVYGKGRHRDPVRSTHSYTAYRWGHKWIVLALLVPFPFSKRKWALPVLVALYLPEGQRRRHKTPAQLLRQMLVVLQRWFPERQFVCSADGNYAAHDLARSAARRKKHLTYVSHFYPNAVLHEPPPPPPVGKKPKGRPPQKGKRLPTPKQEVAQTKQREKLTVAWYGGGRRKVEVVSGTGHWYKSGQGLVEVRWVFVQDVTGTHRQEYFFSTAVTMTPAQIIATYTGRWNIETTFQELRSYGGLQTTRGRCPNTVLRAEPCLFGLYSVVAVLYALLPKKAQVRAVDWKGKDTTTFSDAITAVRRWLWVHWIFARPSCQEGFAKMKRPLRELILAGLAPAA